MLEGFVPIQVRKVERMKPNVEVISDKQKTFIKRERIRRELMKTKPEETICLDGEQTEMLLSWIKELEERAGVHGRKKV